MVLRGNCTFAQKVFNAQLLGAIGVIVGDHNGSRDEWIVMSKEHDGYTISIPAVFVPHSTFQWILRLFQSAALSNEVIYAMLDADGEYVAPTSTIWLAAFGIVIIVIPTLWCLIVCMALLRKRIINYVQSSRRRKHLTQIPVILYKGKGRGIAAAALPVQSGNPDDITLSIANSPCAGHCKSKCAHKASKPEDLNTKLVDSCDDDKSKIKDDMDLLNGSMVGALGQNLKAVSLYLFKPFRDKTPQSTPHNERCAICLDDFKMDEELRLLPCKHAFHKSCVDPWLAKSSELCPMCKQSIFMDGHQQQHKHTCGTLCYWCCISNDSSAVNDAAGNGINRGDDPRIVVLASPDELVSIDSESESREESAAPAGVDGVENQ